MVSSKCRVYMQYYKHAIHVYKRVHFWKGHGPAQPCLFPKLHERSDLIALVCQRSRCAVPRAIASPRRAVPPVLLPMYIVRAQNSESRNLIGLIPPITALHFSEFTCTCDRFCHSFTSPALLRLFGLADDFVAFEFLIACLCFWALWFLLNRLTGGDRLREFVQYISFVCTVSQFWCTLRLPVASCHASF